MPQKRKLNGWFDYQRAAEVVETYNRGAGSSLPADEFVGLSVLPPATGAARDFSYIAPDIPLFDAERCVACMECVQNCPDTAILGKVVTPEEKDRALAESAEEGTRPLAAAQFVRTTKFFKVYEKQHAKNPELPAGAEFGIFVDPTKCKGCGECVEVCGEHRALRMVKKTTDTLADVRALWHFYGSLPPLARILRQSQAPGGSHAQAAKHPVRRRSGIVHGLRRGLGHAPGARDDVGAGWH